MQWTADGPGTARAQEHVAVVLAAELATILRLQMVARIVSAMQATRAIREFAPVRELFAFVHLRRCEHVSIQAFSVVSAKNN